MRTSRLLPPGARPHGMGLGEAAALLDVTPDSLRNAIRHGYLQGTKFGRDWTVTQPDLDRYWQAYRPLTEAERFWSLVDKRGPDECWPWKGGRRPKGYGEFKRRTATHFALRLDGRPVPEGMFACHHCDNPPCVNPAHLFIGTARDNNADMWAKGRAARPVGKRVA